MTVKEISDYVNAYNTRENQRYKMNAVLIYKMGNLNTYAYHQPNKYPRIETAFPEIFDEGKDKAQDWKIMKARMIEYGNKFREKSLQNKRNNV